MATRKVELPSLEPDPLSPAPRDVERYVEALQGLGKANHELARRAAWSQIRLAGVRARSRRAEVRETLDRLFRLGSVPQPPLSGTYSGIVVAFLASPAADLVAQTLASAWMPWLGKRFDADAEWGENLLAPSARLPLRLLGTRVSDGAPEGGMAAFRFRTRHEASELDTDVQALTLDYDLPENPALAVRAIRDELVQVVPGAYLGRALARRRRRASRRLLGYFALQPAALSGQAPEADPERRYAIAATPG